ncbi:MAG: DUF5060 domain-containing protein, partial [Armatimonadetes bacterium]|nr:DUF5060 domain-containing protein [Armatimonadota bacterium]
MPTNLLLLAAALTAPLFELEPRGARLEVGEQGQIAVYRNGEPLLSDARLALWNTAWKGTDQRAAEVLEVRRLAGALELASRLQLDGVAWNILQRVAPEGDGVRLSYELRPAAATEVNEVSLMLDLPVDRYRGRRLLLLPATETTFPAEPPASKHFVMAAASRYVFAAGEDNQISLALDEPHLLNVQDTRLMQGSVYQPFVKIIPERTAVKPGEVFTLSLLLTPRDPAVYQLPRLALSDNRPLALGAVTISERPQAGRRVDLKVELAGRWRTPFWAEEVALDAVIEGAGRSWREPGFYTRDYRRQVVGGNELLEPAGDGRWEVRFLPPEPGEYHVRLTARDASGEVSTTTRFTAAAGTRR